MTNVSVNEVEGAIYSFPSLYFSDYLMDLA